MEKKPLNDHVHIVKSNEVIVIEAPSSGYGETAITWVNGRAVRLDTRTTKKL